MKIIRIDIAAIEGDACHEEAMALITLRGKFEPSTQRERAGREPAGQRLKSKCSEVKVPGAGASGKVVFAVPGAELGIPGQVEIIFDEPDTDPVQTAFQDGYPDFVEAPLKRIESNWSKMGDSLSRMEKKLKRIAR